MAIKKLFQGRARWATRSAFIFAAIGSAVGLGNLWRFPYVAYDNGGGAFLIPYFVALFTTGIPLMMLEFGLGKIFQGAAPKALASIGRRFEWVGWWAVLVGSVIAAYYMVVMSWSILYLYHSFRVPWAGNEKDFFFNKILHISGGALNLGGISWPLIAGLAAAWIIVFLIIHKGIGRISRVVKWTVPLPLILLAVLLAKGLTLPGAMDGIKYYLTPDFAALKNPEVWLAAYAQIFFSLSIGFGILITYASYLKKDADINNNAVITSLANCGTSFFAGFVVFSIIGALAHTTGVPINEVMAGGPGLAFVVFPAALAKLPLAAFFSALFFLILLSLGIDSAFSLVESVISAVEDRIKFRIKRTRLTAVFCILGFVAGIIFTTNAGLYWLDIVDNWMNKYGLVLVGLVQCLVVGYAYNLSKFREEINKSSDYQAGKWFVVCIKYITPAVLIYFVASNIIKEINSPYEGYPSLALYIGGWGLAAALVLAAALLSKHIKKLRIIIFAFLAAALISLVINSYAALAMFIFGSAVLYGGLWKALKKAGR